MAITLHVPQKYMYDVLSENTCKANPPAIKRSLFLHDARRHFAEHPYSQQIFALEKSISGCCAMNFFRMS